MAHLNTLNGLRISLATTLAMLAGGSVASAAEWQPRAAIAGYSSEMPAADDNWQPRTSVQVSQSGLSRGTQAGWAPRSGMGGSAPVELAKADVNTATWQPRAAIANPPTAEPTVIAGWAPRASLESDPKVAGTIARRHRGNVAGTVIALGDFVSTSAISR